MEQMINGQVRRILTAADGSLDSDALRRAGDIPADRPLILQLPDGSNRLVNPGERMLVKPRQHFIDAPKHDRGG